MTEINEFSTVAEIKDYLDSMGISYPKRAKKSILVTLLNKAKETQKEERKQVDDVELMSPQDIERSKYIEGLLNSNDDFLKSIDNYVFLKSNTKLKDAEIILETVEDKPSPTLNKVTAESVLNKEGVSFSTEFDKDEVVTPKIDFVNDVTTEFDEDEIPETVSNEVNASTPVTNTENAGLALFNKVKEYVKTHPIVWKISLVVFCVFLFVLFVLTYLV